MTMTPLNTVTDPVAERETTDTAAKPERRASNLQSLRIRTHGKGPSLAEDQAAKKHWRSLIDDASIRWPRVPREELANVEGSVPRLAGLVQLRERLSREDSNRQVQEFLDAHPRTMD